MKAEDTGETRTAEDLFYLVYASVVTKDFSEDQWLDMVGRLQEKNACAGITGILLHQDGVIVQALEGSPVAVEALYAVIRVDPRHQQVQTLVALPVARRQFPGRWMGFHRFTDEDIDLNAIKEPYSDLPAGGARLSWRACLALRLLARFR